MLRRTVSLASIAFAVSVLTSTGAMATAQRTFVASYGSPANTAFNCSIVKPCRAFSEAVSVTSAGGEVIVLDSAGYGPATITQSVSIIAPPGIYAGVSVSSGDGITINGAGIRVVLRGLAINGLGGLTGISINNAADVEISNCVVSNMSAHGLWMKANGDLLVRDSLFQRNNADGIFQQGGGRGTFERIVSRENKMYGVEISASTVTLQGSTVENNTLDGIVAYTQSYVIVRDSVVQGNGLIGVAMSGGYLRLSTSLVAVNGSHAVHLAGAADAWLLDNTIYNNLQTVAVNPTEVCNCNLNAVAYLSGNAISPTSGFPALGSPGPIYTFGDNKANTAFGGNVPPALLKQ